MSGVPEDLKARARALKLYGVLAHWEEYGRAPWLAKLLEREQQERTRRSFERRLKRARLGRFKLVADFDWSWPEKLDREHVEELLELDFLSEAANIVFVGPNGVGKTTLAKNLAYQALLAGHSARFTTASELLNELCAQEGTTALSRCLQRYSRVRLLVLDEVGYLSYDSRHADLLFDVLSRRSEEKSTIVTTNRPFAEWNEVFPNASCVVALVDRLVHRAEIVAIAGDSFRAKEARERHRRKAKARKTRRNSRSKREEKEKR